VSWGWRISLQIDTLVISGLQDTNEMLFVFVLLPSFSLPFLFCFISAVDCMQTIYFMTIPKASWIIDMSLFDTSYISFHDIPLFEFDIMFLDDEFKIPASTVDKQWGLSLIFMFVSVYRTWTQVRWI